MQMGRIAYVTSKRAFFRTEEAGQDSELDENADILELEQRDLDDLGPIYADVCRDNGRLLRSIYDVSSGGHNARPK
jgi:hypothetical protein